MPRARLRSDEDPISLEAIMEGAQTHLAYLDHDFRFVRVNTTYARGAGYPPEQLIGRYHFDLFPNAENQAIFERVRATGEPATHQAKPFTYAYQPQRGVTYWDWTLTPVPDRWGHPVAFVFSLLDVTEQVVSRERLKEANAHLHDLNRRLNDRLEELRRMEQAKAEHLQVLAHELRNPLTAALGLAQLVQARLAEATARITTEGVAEAHAAVGDLLKLIDKELQRLNHLARDLLTAYRVSSRRLSLTLEPVDFDQVLDQAIEPYRHGLFHVKLLEDRSSRGVSRVLGDIERLIEVLTNLLSNAVKYSPPGSTIWVRTRTMPEGVQVEIEDEGIGIPPGELEQVFEGFRRGSNTADRGPTGVGLGLYISRDLIRRHGGNLWASHRPGGGTIMHLLLPLAGPDQGAPGAT